VGVILCSFYQLRNMTESSEEEDIYEDTGEDDETTLIAEERK
jgi:hypothetical protein